MTIESAWTPKITAFFIKLNVNILTPARLGPRHNATSSAGGGWYKQRIPNVDMHHSRPSITGLISEILVSQP